MTQPFKTDRPELDELFERFRQAPTSTVFAPLADACRKAGMLDEALEICARGLASNPRYASGHVVQGKCYFDSGKAEAAEASFRRVLEFDANNLVALKFIGIIHAERGDADSARRHFEHILALDPDNREIRRRLEHIAADAAVDEPAAAVVAADSHSRGESDDDDDAVDLRPIEDEFEGESIQLGQTTETPDDIATMTLADIYAAQGYTGKALRIYREVQRRQPDNADVRRKIDALESRVARDVPADESSAGATGATPEAPANGPGAAPEPERAAPSPAPANPLAAGSRIADAQSYEQFKRWLRNVS